MLNLKDLANTNCFLRPDTSALHAPTKVNVTENIYQNQYDYSASKLWLSYGVALGVVLLAAFAGFASLIMNGAGFSNDFSTILRASRTAKLSEEVRIGDADGKDPLPKYLSKATVAFVSGTFSPPERRHGVVEIVSYSEIHHDGTSADSDTSRAKKAGFFSRITRTTSNESHV
jgi:hypothetical protein